MKEAKQRFPADMDYAISLDQTDSVREGMREIVKTLVEAILFVVVVVSSFYKVGVQLLFRSAPCRFHWLERLYYFLYSDSRSIRFRFSG